MLMPPQINFLYNKYLVNVQYCICMCDHCYDYHISNQWCARIVNEILMYFTWYMRKFYAVLCACGSGCIYMACDSLRVYIWRVTVFWGVRWLLHTLVTISDYPYRLGSCMCAVSATATAVAVTGLQLSDLCNDLSRFNSLLLPCHHFGCLNSCHIFRFQLNMENWMT